MRIRIPGHLYQLDELKADFSGVIKNSATLRFVSRVGANYPGNLDSFDGTTTQEVLRCLVDRAIYVNNQKFYWFTWLSIWLFRLAIWLYEKRAADIHKKPFSFKLSKIETYLSNDTDGHIV